jgi:hypothetical protein
VFVQPRFQCASSFSRRVLPSRTVEIHTVPEAISENLRLGSIKMFRERKHVFIKPRHVFREPAPEDGNIM